MFDRDLENLKEQLRRKLPEYLQKKGINPQAKFSCLNPDHPDHHPSMSYNPTNCTVHCFSCGKTYDIFDLAGLDYGLKTFTEQLRKVHELFIGPMPMPAFKPLNSIPINPMNQSNHAESSAHFEPLPRGQNGINPNRMNAEQNQTRPQFEAVKPQTYKSSIQIGPSGITFGGAANSNDENPPASAYLRSRDNIFSLNRNETMPDYRAYLKYCADHAGHTDYFLKRGISDQTAAEFSLGYDDHFPAGIDPVTGSQIIWQAAIIPYGNNAYLARNTDPEAKDRIRKRGRAEIFNLNTLSKPGRVFITEGEFDALSFETLGLRAVSLGGVGNVNLLLQYLRQHPVSGLMFYICLDNDASGIAAANQLAAGLQELQIAFCRINPSFPYKDPNEALCRNRAEFSRKLNHLDELLAVKLTPMQVSANLNLFISNAESLLNLNLSPALYTICARPALLRRFCADLIDANHSRSLVMAGTLPQWQMICALMQSQPDHEPKFSAYKPHAAAGLLTINNQESITNTVKQGISSLQLTDRRDLVLIVDLSVFRADKTALVLTELATAAMEQQTPIIALCPPDLKSEAEANALQNLDLMLRPDGVINCITLDQKGRTQSFALNKE